MHRDYDILIVGAGVAGCAAAIALKNCLPEYSVCIVDRAPDDIADQTGGRASLEQTIGETLPAQVVIPMQQLGIWEEFLSLQALPCSGTRAWWGSELPNENESIYSAYGNGWHIDRNKFNRCLLTHALGSGVELLHNTELLEVRASSKNKSQLPIWKLSLANADRSPFKHALTDGSMTARFIIDATGRSANLARKLGAKKQHLDKLVGIYQYFQASEIIDSSTVIEAVEYGWWYSAALPSGQRVVTLMTDADVARQNRYRTADKFRQALFETQNLSECLRGHQIASQPIVTAANTQRLDTLAGTAWLATGDAAFTFDPLSSLGLFKALRMAVIASYAVTDYFSGKDPELTKFQCFANAEFASYLDKKREYYSQQSRFKQQLFWQRRRAA